MGGFVWIVVAAVILIKVITVIASIVKVYTVTKKGWQKATETLFDNKTSNKKKKAAPFNPFSGETPEQFFERIRSEEKKESKLKLNDKHQLQKKALQAEAKFDALDSLSNLAPAPKIDAPKVNSAQTKIHHKVDVSDKKALRKAIIINEVLGPPKAYDL